MAVVTVGFRWLDILEKEFDKAFVDLEVLVGDVCEYEEGEIVAKAQHRLQSLSSCFAQLTHKAQTIFQNNAKLEAELVHLRREVAETKGQLSALQQQQQQQLNGAPHAPSPHNAATSEHTKLLDNEEEATAVAACGGDIQSLVSCAEVWQLQQENKALRRLTLRLQGELCGARLAAKYLDKELAGRIQQLQLLGRETRWQQQEDKLWRQLEAEINLHRHKTVVRACRANLPAHTGVQTECTTSAEEASEEASEMLAADLHDDQPRPQHLQRTVVIQKQLHQNLGMSVTGGREHGVPIVVSVVHPNTPASDCGSLYVGDAILAVNGQDLSAMNHSAAVALLSRPAETVTLQLLFVPPESDDTCSYSDDPFTFKYGLFDDDVASMASSSCSVVPRHRPPPPPALDSLSRASVDSVRGSCDDLLTEDSLARGFRDLGAAAAQSADVPVETNCSEDPASGVGLESEVAVNSAALSTDHPSKSNGEHGRLLPGPPPEGAGVTTAAFRDAAVNAEHRVAGEQTSPAFPPLPETNSSPLIGVYRKHSIPSGGPPSSPPTPVHRKYSSSNSSGHKYPESRYTSLVNCDKDVRPSMAGARSQSIPEGGGAESPAEVCGQSDAVVTHHPSGAVPFSRRSSSSAAPLTPSSGRGGEALDETNCEAVARLPLPAPGTARCADASTVIFNGSY